MEKAVLKDQKCQDHEKFYPIIKKGIKRKCKEEDVDYDSLKRVPSKGAESADFLIKFITVPENIPLKIIEAFDKLN